MYVCMYVCVDKFSSYGAPSAADNADTKSGQNIQTDLLYIYIHTYITMVPLKALRMQLKVSYLYCKCLYSIYPYT